MHRSPLAFYQLLSGLLPRCYVGKLLGVALAGTCLPLIGVLVYVSVTNAAVGALWETLAVAAIALIIGAGLSAYGIHRLLAPIALSALALGEYADERRMPALPAGHRDLAGRLMSEVQRTVELLEHRNRTLTTSAMRDFLTGAFNRRAGAEHLHSDTARAARDGSGYTLAFIDLDNLKQINDRHGHHFGDLCLKRLVDTISAGMRKGDWIARWGGDEFVLLLWNVDMNAAAEVLVRLGNAFRNEPLTTETGDTVCLQISAGVCQHQLGWQGDTVLRYADAALYEAKHNGKGAVVTTDGSRHTCWSPTINVSTG
ncbi:MAG: GGDEF domain-containing protein [Gammaproteobacteria bacterium]